MWRFFLGALIACAAYFLYQAGFFGAVLPKLKDFIPSLSDILSCVATWLK